MEREIIKSGIMEITDKDLNDFSDNEIIEMSTKLAEMKTFSDRFGYLVATTGFTYIGWATAREISGKDYWWGISYMSDEESRIAGNVYIKNRKETFIKEITTDITSRIKKCENHLEVKNLIEAEINKIHNRVESGNLLHFKNGYESEKRKSNTYFDKTSGVKNYEEATLGAAYYKIEQMLINEVLPQVNGIITENSSGIEKAEPINLEIKKISHVLVLMKKTGIIDHLLEKFPNELENHF